VKKYLRMIAKRFGFLVIYGGQRDKLYKTMAADRNPDGSRSFPDLQPKDVEMWFDNWHKGHPQTRRWQEGVVRAWNEYGFVGTLLDNRRRFFIGGPDPTAMPNMTIQGSAASIMNRAMKRIAAECPYRGWSPLSGAILQVHDYVGLQVPLARQKDAENLLNEAMPYEQNGMKYIIEQKSGLTWDQT
jgi:DNA polymerase I-like protein with 3'-5' exonuclease and polymerase domains